MNNIDWTKTYPTNQDEFIYYSIFQLERSKYKIYFEKLEGTWRPSHWTFSQNNGTSVEKLYFEGFFVLKLLKCSFEEFSVAVIKKEGIHPFHVERESRILGYRNRYFHYHPVEFREPMKFQQNGTKKKQKDTTKSDWRSNKGFERDFRKNEKGLHKTFAKRSSNKEFRRMEKQKIQSGKYEELFWGKRKDYFDPWDWD